MWELCLRFFSYIFRFCKTKGCCYWNLILQALRPDQFGLLQIGHKLERWQWSHNLLTLCHHQFFWRCIIFLVKFSHWSNFMPISWLVLELWQFSFRTDSREIHKSEIPTSEFYPISGDWGKLEILGKFGINVSNEMLLNATKC